MLLAQCLDMSARGYSWCEPDYAMSPYIAEFWNTLSNIPLVVLPLMSARLVWRYAWPINWYVLIAHLAVAIVGIMSIYYHATLSLFGQLLDEWSILWAVSSFVMVVWPYNVLLPEMVRTPRITAFVRALIVVIAILFTAGACVHPVWNAFALIALSPPTMYMTYKLTLYHIDVEPQLWQSFRDSFYYWMIGTAFWLADRFMCPLLLDMRFVIAHAIFHVTISYATYLASIVFNYTYIYGTIHKRHDDWHVAIARYPRTGPIYVPYIQMTRLNTTHSSQPNEADIERRTALFSRRVSRLNNECCHHSA